MRDRKLFSYRTMGIFFLAVLRHQEVPIWVLLLGLVHILSTACWCIRLTLQPISQRCGRKCVAATLSGKYCFALLGVSVAISLLVLLPHGFSHATTPKISGKQSRVESLLLNMCWWVELCMSKKERKQHRQRSKYSCINLGASSVVAAIVSFCTGLDGVSVQC